MKKQFFIIALAMCTFFANAQINVISGGNVGIATTTPAYKLTLAGNGGVFGVDNTAVFLAKNSAGTYEPYLWPRWSDNIMYMNYGSAGFNIRNNSSTSTMFMTNDGKVGIGDNTPLEPLTVGNGDLFRVTGAGYVRSVSGAQGNPTYSFTGSTNTGMFSSAASILNFSTGGTERMRLDASGNVAIGASTISGVRFYVFGGLNRYYYSNANGNETLNFELYPPSDPRIYSPTNTIVFYNTTGNPPGYIDLQARNFYQSSDLSLKTNILDLSNSLDKVIQLRGVSYNWINDSLNSKVNTGFIAQEVEQIIPELVITIDSTQNKLLNYIGLMPYLVEAIKEQNATITQQGLEIQALKASINTLETDLAKCCNVPANKSLQLPNGTNNNENGSNPALYQNIPNPFNVKTVIGYYLPNETANASLLVFDMQGKLIKTYKIATSGKANIEINGGELQPGMYMYSLIANGKEVDTKKMILTE